MELRCGTHTSSLKEAEFTHVELEDQVQAGHVAVSPLKEVKAFQNLRLSTVMVIPQVRREPRLILDFTWRVIKKATKCLAPMEATHFGSGIHCILKQVLMDDPQLGTV